MLGIVRTFAFGLSTAFLCVQPVAAQVPLSAKLSAQQTWTMSAPLGQKNPDCVETWTLFPDGKMTIQSGAERVDKQWRVGEGDESQSLYTRRMASTGGLDCLNMQNTPFDEPQPEDVEPIWILAFNGNDELLLCNPQYVTNGDTDKRMRMYGENCWGRLVPAK